MLLYLLLLRPLLIWLCADTWRVDRRIRGASRCHAKQRRYPLTDAKVWPVGKFLSHTCSDGVIVGVCQCVSSAGELRTLRFFFWTVLWSTRKERARYNCLHCHTPTHMHMTLAPVQVNQFPNRIHILPSHLIPPFFLPLSPPPLSLSLSLSPFSCFALPFPTDQCRGVW